MQRHLRREHGVGNLPPLEESSTRFSSRYLRFKEAPPQPQQCERRRRTSKLPELVRRDSIISTYRNELYQPKIVTFMKNGDRFFEGVKVNVSSRNFRHWDVLLSELSRSIDLPAGVRHIYTPDNGHRVTTLGQFQHQRAYVCGSTEPFKKILYAKVKTPTWHTGTRVKHTTGTLLDATRNPDRARIAQNQTMDTIGQAEGDKERKRKRGCVRKISFATEVQENRIPIPKSPLRKQTSGTVSPPPSQGASPFTIICSGPPPRKVVTVFLNRQHIASWEQARSLIGESLQSVNGCMRLYSVDGMEVESLSQLWSTNNVLISAGHGDFSIAEFLQGHSHSAEPMEDIIQSHQQQTRHNIMSPGKELETEDECVSSGLTGSLLQEKVLKSEQSTSCIEWRGGDGDEEHVVDDEEGGNMERSEGVEVQVGEDKVTRVEEEREEQTRSKTMMPTQSAVISEHVQSEVLESADAKNEPHSDEQQPSSARNVQGETELYPTNSMLTVTEDSSFLDSGSPLTVAKAAVIQHLHRLALQYDDDHASMSGSEGSINMRFASASRPSVLYPQSPQSNISYSPHHSLVEMILPKENGFNSGMSIQSTSSSSKHSSQPIKSRTVGIQTDLIGDKLSAIIEEDQQPSGLDQSTRKRRITHPLFHTQTSLDSLPTTTNCSVSHRRKDGYSVGPVQSEGRFAVVRKCHHKMTGQQYSLRVINKAGIYGHEDLIWREYEMLCGLKHENLVQVVDGWESSDDICMVVEHVEGADLFDVVLHCQHFCEADVICAMKQLSMALVYLHAHKIAHRDIKLENIFLHHTGEGDWSLKLGGMSLAAIVSEPLSLICGTTFYMAPEMITETGYGTKLDVWAAGVICCTLLSGIMPFGSNSKRATMSNIRRGRYSFLSPFWDDVSDEAKDFVRHLLVVSPHKRYMATQMLQHPWLGRERWEDSERRAELNSVLMEHLASKSTSAKTNAVLPTLIVTALDKRKSLPHANPQYKNIKVRAHKKES